MRPRSFNTSITLDACDLTLTKHGKTYKLFLLVVIDSATSLARAFPLQHGTASDAAEALERGWFGPYGLPDVVFTDPDTMFRSSEFAKFLSQRMILLRLSAADAPWQHGQVENLNRMLEHRVQLIFEGGDDKLTPQDAVSSFMIARNELLDVDGVSPNMLAFGRNPRVLPLPTLLIGGFARTLTTSWPS